jgi:hypothetical protein
MITVRWLRKKLTCRMLVLKNEEVTGECRNLQRGPSPFVLFSISCQGEKSRSIRRQGMWEK